jgi:fibronectin-binding autotransporter adhesin
MIFSHKSMLRGLSMTVLLLLVGACAASTAEAQTFANVGTGVTRTLTSNTTNPSGDDGVISPDGTLKTTDGITLTNAGVLLNLGTLTNANGGTINNANTLNNLGTLTNANGGTINNEGGILSNTGTLTNGGTLTNANALTNANTLTNGGTLTNTGILTNIGTLTNANTLTNTGLLANSDVLTNDGTLTNEAGGTLSGDITNNGSLVFDSALSSIYGGVASGTGSLTKEGSGTLTLTGANTYTGGSTIDAGSTLGITNSNALGTGVVTFNGGTLQAGANDLDMANAVAVNSPGGTVDNNGNSFTLSGPIADGTGSGGLSFTGAGTTILTGANTYTGGTTINGSTLAIGAGGSLAATGPVTLVGLGATFDISGAGSSQTIGALSGVAGSDVDIGTNSLIFGDASNTVFTGGFTGAGNLVKQGGGLVTLNGNASAFAGTITIDDGTLEVGDTADPSAVLGGDVAVASGGTLRGHGTIDGNVTNDGVVFPGGSIGVLTVNGNFTQTSGGTLNIEITPSTVAGTGFDQLQVTGSASLAGALAVQVDNGTYSVGSQYDILHAAGGVSGSFNATTFTPALAAFITPVVKFSADDVTLELTPADPNANLADSLAFSTGRIYAASNFAQNGILFNALLAPLNGTGTAGTDTDQGYWLHGLGAFGQANGFDFNEQGFAIGKGFTLSPHFTLGGGVSNFYTATSGGASTVNGSSVGAQVYGIYTAGPATVSASAMAGHLGTTISRGLPTLGETAKATSNGAYEAAALYLQYNLLSGSRFFVAPYVSASYLHTGLGGATETGAGILNLHYDAMSTSLAELGAGVSGGLSLPVKYGTLTAWAGLGGEGTLGNPHVRDTEVLGTFSAGESALAAPVGTFTPTVGVELTGHGPWRLAAAWGGQFGSATSAENFSLEGRYVW